MGIFNRDFYPTPTEVIEQMCFQMQLKGATVLEPSAGSGNIVKYLNKQGATVLACEKEPELRKVLSGECTLIANDFLDVKAEDVSHISAIVMNPPFSADEAHILHAYDIAPEGCEIIALCNYATYENYDRYSRRKQLRNLINDYGEILEMGDVFSEAERKTNVSVGMVRLFKPLLNEARDWEGFYTETDEEPQSDGVIQYSEVRALVNTYMASVKCFDRFMPIGQELNGLTKSLGFGEGFRFSVGYSDREGVTTKEDFARALQKHLWAKVFGMFNIERYVTRGVMQDINAFVHNRKNYPFTMRNIYRMVEVIFGTRETTMNKAIVEAVDNLTKYTHENRYGLPGWKTNAGYLLNKKIIIDYAAEYSSYSDSISVRYNSDDKLMDLLKVYDYLSANPESTLTPYRWFQKVWNSKSLEPNCWYNAGIFEFKVFKKGTMHLKFQDMKDWELINRAYAKAKGQVLPEVIKTA